MTSILIVEDELIIAEDISIMLQILGYQVTGIEPTGEEALKNIEKSRPHIILMDIGLGGTLDGVQTAQHIYEHYHIPIIFLTANSDNATFQRAKNTHPYGFVTKPFRQSELHRTIELALERVEEEQKMAEKYLNDTTNQPSYLLDDRIFVRYRDRMIRVQLTDILFAEADGRYAKIYTSEGEFFINITLSVLEEKLSVKDFQRIHRSTIINVSKVDSFGLGFSSVYIGKHNLPVGRTFVEPIAQRLNLL